MTSERAVATELSDATGTCTLALDSVLLVAPTQLVEMDEFRCAAEFPELFAQLDPPPHAKLTVEQTYIADGATVTASGEVAPDQDLADPGDGYRGPSRTRVRLTSATDRPLLLSAFAESDVRLRLRRPALLFATLALGAAAVGGSLLFVALAMRA